LVALLVITLRGNYYEPTPESPKSAVLLAAEGLRKLCENFKSHAFVLVLKVHKMVIVYEELKAAKAAKAAIDALLTATRKAEVLATLSKARRCAF